MPCLGKAGLIFAGIVKHKASIQDNGVTLFNNIKVHCTHTMATHVGLKVHFCTHCGAYGKDISHFLQQKCSPVASHADRMALESIRNGVMHNRWNPSVSGLPVVSPKVSPGLSVTGLPRPGPGSKRNNSKRSFVEEDIPPLVP